MSNDTDGIRRAVVLCLSGIQLGDIRAIPEVEMLVKQGVMVELEPSPITGPMTQMYQAFSGRSPASFGFFDTLVPHDYAIVEETTGRGTSPKLLPDLLRTVGWTVHSQEVPLAALITTLQAWVAAVPTASTCLIARCNVEMALDTQLLARALQLARAWVGETGLLAIFSDTHSAPVKRFVNLNNFLAEASIIERDEQSGQINWSNSLAYFAGHGQLWINLLGRDPQGAVHPQGEHEEVCATLARALPDKVRDHGQQAVERVCRKEELYTSEYSFCLPDLVVVFMPGYAPSPLSTRINFDDAVFTSPVDGVRVNAGLHPSCVRGFLLASAPALMRGVSLADPVPLTSVAPTLLHALGAEYVAMETSAVSELFLPSYLEKHPVRSGMQGQELSEEDEERIINHLRSLGYV